MVLFLSLKCYIVNRSCCVFFSYSIIYGQVSHYDHNPCSYMEDKEYC